MDTGGGGYLGGGGGYPGFGASGGGGGAGSSFGPTGAVYTSDVATDGGNGNVVLSWTPGDRSCAPVTPTTSTVVPAAVEAAVVEPTFTG